MKKIFAFILMFVCSGAVAHAEPYAFPVPFVQSQHSVITFTALPSQGTIKIITINGELVQEIPFDSAPPSVAWPVTNSNGKAVATGVYYFEVSGDGQKKTGKLVIIR